MAQDLDIRHFFRRAPTEWLRRYFARDGLFLELDWGALGVRKIEPLWEAWLALDDTVRGRIVADFNGIKLLATPVGKVQIIDEAAYHGKQREIADRLADLDDFYDCAFWVMLEHPDCWNGAVFFASADGKSKRYWRKRINMPLLGRRPTPADGQALSLALSSLFRATEGRGHRCVVHQFRRGVNGELEYYFAYPQDHKQTTLEYREGEFTKRPFNPAFEIVFVHDDEQQTLSIWHEGKKERIKDLQVAFAKAIMGQDILRESPQDDRVYNLDVFRQEAFRIDPSPEFGIAGIEVRKLGVRVLGEQQHTINIDLGDKTPSHILYQRLAAATADIPSSMLKVSRIGLRVTFELGPREPRPKTRSFELAWPNSCSLQNDSHGILIQRMLADHKIEPRRPPASDADANPDN